MYCIDPTQVDLWMNNDYWNYQSLMIKFSWCDQKKLPRGQVCKSKEEVLSIFNDQKYGGVYL